jgi:hypothetical protein
VAPRARFASAAKAQAVARLPEERRARRHAARPRAHAGGGGRLDLFDAVSTSMFASDGAAAREAHPRSLRDLAR